MRRWQMRAATQARRSRTKLVEKNSCGDSDVQRFDAARERQRDELSHGGAHLRAQSCTFVADGDCEAPRRFGPSGGNPVHIRAPERDARTFQEQSKRVPCTMKRR